MIYRRMAQLKLNQAAFTYDVQKFDPPVLKSSVVLDVQGFTIRPFPGCKNAARKLRQKWYAAGTKFTKPGNDLIEKPCTEHP